MKAIVRARVTQVSAPAANAAGEFTIDADELSSGYLWETLIALAKSDDGGLPPNTPALQKHEEPSFGTRSDAEVGATMPRSCSYKLSNGRSPDLFAARRYVKLARRAGWLALPYLENEELRRRVVGYKPMSEEEWERLWPRSGVKPGERVGANLVQTRAGIPWAPAMGVARHTAIFLSFAVLPTRCSKRTSILNLRLPDRRPEIRDGANSPLRTLAPTVPRNGTPAARCPCPGE